MLAVAAVACTGPTVITTDDATYTPAPSSAPAPTTTVASNAHLANAFDFAAEVDGDTAYYFTSPSRRWECAIVPRVRAGCQNAQSSTLGVTGAPPAVPGPDGTSGAPNAVVVDRTAPPRFARLDTPAFGLGEDGQEAAVLPFNRILAVAGFRCNVQEAVGISCLSESSGNGFTFSADEYRPHYVDVPADAP
ncbi:hypothetical protein MDUV_12540 [Mycolicibacterium duvalii]|uniref:Uncharacterized protein n=1 Tax=Mycolicibacterium duvalii TaxID=39688 RepID=A0A7I7JYK1_9MYCO|nr:hypothetical protein MDUV_12540 [Mycolicibacterium duvalii]